MENYDDIVQIQEVVERERHVLISEELAQDIWEAYSNSWAAGWLMLTPMDDTDNIEDRIISAFDAFLRYRSSGKTLRLVYE